MSNTGFVVWFTGLSGSGKSTLTEALAPVLLERGLRVEVLDGLRLSDLAEGSRERALVLGLLAEFGHVLGEYQRLTGEKPQII